MKPTTIDLAEALAQCARDSGGFTYSLKEETHRVTGYAVAVPDHEETFIDLDARDILGYIDRHEPALARKHACLGAWFNASDSLWYLDISRVVPTLDEAQYLGKLGGQRAVYDLDAKEEVPVDHE